MALPSAGTVLKRWYVNFHQLSVLLVPDSGPGTAIVTPSLTSLWQSWTWRLLCIDYLTMAASGGGTLHIPRDQYHDVGLQSSGRFIAKF